MKVKIKIPTEINEIDLQDFQSYLKIADESENEEFLKLKMVNIFCGLKIKEVRDIRASDFQGIIDTLTKTFTEKGKFVQRFKIGDIEYGFIPDLDDMSTGEFIDLSNYMGDVQTLHKAMAVLYRPITYEKDNKYLIEDYEGSDKYSDIMKYAKLGNVLGSQVFFYNLGKELLRITVSSLQEEAQTNSQLKQLLEQNGDGINQFMDWLEGTSYDLMTSLN